MRPYTNDPDWPNRKLDGYGARVELGFVTGAFHDYTVELDQRIVPNGTLVVESGVDTLTPIPWGVEPSVGQVSVSYELPLLKFHPSRESEALQVTYTAGGGVLSSARRAEIVPPVTSVNTKTGDVVLDATDIEHITSGESVESFLNLLFGETENLALTKQQASAVLSAIAAAGNGMLAKTGTGTAAPRTITAGTGISVSNGNGVSGNPAVAVSQTALLNTSSGSNTLLATHAFIQINLNTGTQTILLNNASIPVGWGCWASIINSHASNQLTWDAGSGNNVHAPGVFAQTWAMSTASNVPHRWFRLCKISSTVWSIDTGAPS